MSNSDSGLHLGFDTLQAPPLRFVTAVLSRLARLLPAQPPVALARASRRLAHPLSARRAGQTIFPAYLHDRAYEPYALGPQLTESLKKAAGPSLVVVSVTPKEPAEPRDGE